MQENMFQKREDFLNLSEILDKWTQDETKMKEAFVRLADRFREKKRGGSIRCFEARYQSFSQGPYEKRGRNGGADHHDRYRG